MDQQVPMSWSMAENVTPWPLTELAEVDACQGEPEKGDGEVW